MVDKGMCRECHNFRSAKVSYRCQMQIFLARSDAYHYYFIFKTVGEKGNIGGEYFANVYVRIIDQLLSILLRTEAWLVSKCDL